jgi:hypothetical protein
MEIQQLDIQKELLKAEKASKFKKQLLETYPKERNTDLNLERVDGYVRENGLNLGEYIVVSDEELDKIWKEGVDLGLFHEDDRVGWEGKYLGDIDLVIVRRRPELETLNGKIYTESILVHELAHSSSGIYIDHPQVRLNIKSGFNRGYSGGWGGFLEEGFAELLRGNYMAKFMKREDLKRLSKASYIGTLNKDSFTSSNSFDFKDIGISYKYFYIIKEGGVAIKPNALASTALELLMVRDRTLFKTLISARSSVEGARKLALKLNRISPGLYVYLQKGELVNGTLSTDSYVEKYLYVLNHASGIVGKVAKLDSKIIRFLRSLKH